MNKQEKHQELQQLNSNITLNIQDIMNSGAKKIVIAPKNDRVEVKVIKDKSVTKMTQNSNGIYKENTISAYGNDMREQIVTLYTAENKTQVEIAEIFDIPQSKVSRILQSEGFSRGSRCSNFIDIEDN